MRGRQGGRVPGSAPNPFSSFFMGGFECSTHINRSGQRLDLLRATGHDRHAQRDYALLRSQGITTARDGLRWHLIDMEGRLDFSSFLPMIKAAAAEGVQVIWDLCHYGWPADLDIFSPEFVTRFADYCREAVLLMAEHQAEPPLVIPVNEISFFAWAAGEAALFHPFARGRAPELKRQLVRAALRAADAIHEAVPHARILTAEPIINVVRQRGLPPGGHCPAAVMQEAQYEAWDMLAGHRDPELGGGPDRLDVIGVNFYPQNQWELPDGMNLERNGPRADGRWKPLRHMLLEVWQRYGRPLFLAETGRTAPGRAEWLAYVTEEVAAARAAGVPLYGICLYPIIDRPDWDDPDNWHRCGLWDRETCPRGRPRHVLRRAYAEQLRASSLLLGR